MDKKRITLTQSMALCTDCSETGTERNYPSSVVSYKHVWFFVWHWFRVCFHLCLVRRTLVGVQSIVFNMYSVWFFVWHSFTFSVSFLLFFLLSAEDSGSCSKYSVYHVFCLILCLTLVQCLISALLSAEDFGSCSKCSVCHVFCLMVPPAQEWNHSIFVKTKYQCSTHCPSMKVSGDKAPLSRAACMHVRMLFCVCVCVWNLYTAWIWYVAP